MFDRREVGDEEKPEMVQPVFRRRVCGHLESHRGVRGPFNTLLKSLGGFLRRVSPNLVGRYTLTYTPVLHCDDRPSGM